MAYVSDANGVAEFFTENLARQNNSLLSEYHNANANEKLAYIVPEKNIITVETVTLDSFCEQHSVKPNFVKIDIEGAELLSIRGALHMVKTCQPAMMIEITVNWETLLSILDENNYLVFQG